MTAKAERMAKQGEDFGHLREFLESRVALYNRPEFIHSDPISVPHAFSSREDIEISGLFSAVLAWGSRTVIIRNARELMRRMDDAPHEFIMHFGPADLRQLAGFVHRTYNEADAAAFCEGLRRIYKASDGLEEAFRAADGRPCPDMFRKALMYDGFPLRTQRHVPHVARGSAAKRIRMFLRWMVRRDEAGVDFGLWKGYEPAHLEIPLDVHSGTVARSLGLLKRRQNDARAVRELTDVLRGFDSQDPVRYDFALFGIGAFGHINDLSA